MKKTSQQTEENATLTLLSPNKKLKAVFQLEEGGRVQQLMYNGHKVIDDLEHMPYQQSYAGSILFPFANRIQNGTYQFKDETYHLSCNEIDKGNAIHGLIYNKKFEVFNSNESEDANEITLIYEEKDPPKGFPFLFQVKLIYTLTNLQLSLKVEVQNTGAKAFPFNLGWHPYFYCDDFDTSFLSFNSHKVVIMNEKMIALGINERLIENPFSLKNKELDDCYVLNGREVSFFTPNYKIELQGFPKSNFLQLYTPPNENRIAIEPMTGISDSFNHKKGLQMLKPKKIKSETWVIQFLD